MGTPPRPGAVGSASRPAVEVRERRGRPPEGRLATLKAVVPRVVERAGREFFSDGCPHFAASIAYRVLFSLFPLAILLTGVFAIVLRSTGSRDDVIDAIVRNIPLDEDGTASLTRLLEGATGGLGALGLLGIVGLIWAASGMMSTIRAGLNTAWDIDERRPFLQGKLVDLLLLLCVAVLALLSLGLAIATRTVSRYAEEAFESAGLGFAGAEWLLGTAAPFVLAFVATLVLYLVVPAQRPLFGDVWLPAALVAAFFALAQSLFALYVEHFASYNEIYGSLGAIIGFLFFVYVAASVFLFGAELAASTPRVRDEVARGEGLDEGEPIGAQVKGFLLGLVVSRDRDREQAQGHEPPDGRDTGRPGRR